MFNIMLFLKMGNWAYKRGIPFIPSLMKGLIRLIFNSAVDPRMIFGKNLKFSYGGIAVVIHKRAEIGNNVTIGQCVTIGGRSKKKEVPKLGDNVVVSAGSMILGDVIIGNNVVIGANSTVLKDVPDNCVVAGSPARIVKENITSVNDYV